MERKRWNLFAKFGVLLMSLFAIFVINSENTSAFSFGTAQPRGIAGIEARGDKGGTNISFSQYVPQYNSNYKLEVAPATGVQSASNITTFLFDLGYSYIPAGSLFNFSLRFQTDSTSEGLAIVSEYSGQNWSLLNKNCTTLRSTRTSTAEILNDVYCTYWGYASSDISAYLILQGRWYFPYGSGVVYAPLNIGLVELVSESGGSFTGLTESELNGTFRNFLDNKLSQLYGNGLDQLNALNQIKALLQTQGATETQTKEAIEELVQQQQAQAEQDQQDRQDLQDAQSDADTSADSSSAQAESTGTTLLQGFTSFVNALTSANPSDCNIDFNIMGYINGGKVNLCQLSLPPAFQAIGSLILIGFCVPLSIATGRKVIELFKSFQR